MAVQMRPARQSQPQRNYQSSSIDVRPSPLRPSNVAVSNLRPNSRAWRQESSSSVRVGGRAISAYLSRYLALAGSQKLSGRNCAITLTGAAGVRSAIHSSTGYVQHSTWLGITKCRIEKSSPQSASSAMLRVTVSQYHGVFPFWQKAHRMLQEVKKIVPEPCVPR